MTKAIRITCSAPGFCRFGVQFPAEKTFPADRFTAEQLEALRADPVLRVAIVGAKSVKPVPARPSPVDSVKPPVAEVPKKPVAANQPVAVPPKKPAAEPAKKPARATPSRKPAAKT